MPYTEAVEKALVAARAGETVTVEHLTASERLTVATAMGWTSDAKYAGFLSDWIATPHKPVISVQGDYERLILDEQESDPSYWG